MKKKLYLLLDTGVLITDLKYTDLYFYYKNLGLVQMSDIKYVGWFEEEFIPNRIALGDNIFYEGQEPYDRQLVAQKGKQKLTFSSIEEAINYIKENKISSASLGTIKSTIFRNLTGKSKSAYGMKWEIKPI